MLCFVTFLSRVAFSDCILRKNCFVWQRFCDFWDFWDSWGTADCRQGLNLNEEHFGAKSSPILKGPQNPFVWSMDSHDFWTPKCKRCSKTRFERPNAFWGLKNIKKRRTRMPKCGLGHLGAKRAPTAPLERLGAFGPLRTPKNVGHVCKSAKVDFCNFIFMFSKNKKVTKSHFHVLAYVYDVFGCSESLKSTFGALGVVRS